MALINTIEDLREYVNVVSGFDFKLAERHIKRAERKFVARLIGSQQLQEITSYGGTEEKVLQVKSLLREAAANYGMMLALPFVNNKVSNSGTRKDLNKEAENAPWYEVRDLLRGYSSTASGAIDEALEIMEQNTSSFSLWKDSSYYTVFMGLFVRRTDQFNEGFFINGSRTVFLSLRSYLKEVEEQYLQPMLGDLYPELKKDSANEKVKRAQELARLASVALTVAKVAASGAFQFTPGAMTVYNEELPWDKNKAALSGDQLKELRNERQNAGEEYLKKLKTHVVKNKTDFPLYVEAESSGLEKKIIKKTGFLMT